MEYASDGLEAHTITGIKYTREKEAKRGTMKTEASCSCAQSRIVLYVHHIYTEFEEGVKAVEHDAYQSFTKKTIFLLQRHDLNNTDNCMLFIHLYQCRCSLTDT